ncbi:MAG: ribosome biogenesis GTP-binding protein YihA/YsxC [Thermodesulfobacteriota bacterium]
MSHWSQGQVSFVKSVYKTAHLPAPDLPELAFAGRSNVGKSSLINKLINRRNLVKVSSRPGKTQALNYFLASDQVYLVDLPGYGYAKVPRKLKNDWQGLISSYLTSRSSLYCVVVIIDIRHELKALDLELVTWLRSEGIPHLVVYTKIDKLKRSQQQRQAALLDSGLGIRAEERVLFSAKNGEGKENLISMLDQFLA